MAGCGAGLVDMSYETRINLAATSCILSLTVLPLGLFMMYVHYHQTTADKVTPASPDKQQDSQGAPDVAAANGTTPAPSVISDPVNEFEDPEEEK